jgi:hypothetical protein
MILGPLGVEHLLVDELVLAAREAHLDDVARHDA